MRPIKRFEDVELIIPANNTAQKINFPDIPQLRSDVEKDVIVRAIRVYTAEAIPNSFNNNPLLTTALMGKVFLTLYVSGEESIFRIPLLDMVVQNGNNGATQLFWVDDEKQFENIQVDWTKSYISFSSALGNGAIIVAMFGITYQYLAPGTMNAIRARQAVANASGVIM